MKVKIDKITKPFYNANKAIINICPEAPMIDHKLLWETTHHLKIIQGPWGEWHELEFSSEEDYMMFILKWS